LHTWHSVGNIEKQGNDLFITLVPDSYEESKENPVINIVAVDTASNPDSEELTKISQGWVIDAEIDGNCLLLWEEFADEPVVVRASRIIHRSSDYSTEQLKFYISFYKELLDEESKKALLLDKKLDASVHLVDELINRAEIKLDKSKNKTVAEAQLKVLRRVKKRMQGT
jgi:hypothetical protein